MSLRVDYSSYKRNVSMTCCDNEQCPKSKLKEKCNSGAEQTWTPKKLEVGLGAVEEKIPFYIV